MKLTMVDGNFEESESKELEETVIVTICITNTVQQFYLKRSDCKIIKEM